MTSTQPTILQIFANALSYPVPTFHLEAICEAYVKSDNNDHKSRLKKLLRQGREAIQKTGKDPELTKVLMNYLDGDFGANEKLAALNLLSQFPDPAAVDSVIELLENNDFPYKATAVHFLGLQVEPCPRAFIPLFELYKKEENYTTRESILRFLNYMLKRSDENGIQDLKDILDPHADGANDINEMIAFLNETTVNGDDQFSTLKILSLETADLIKNKILN